MSRIRVLDLAKEVGIETKAAIIKLQELGIQVKNHFNALSETEAAKFRAYVRSGKNPEKESAQKAAASRIIIRRRAEVAPAATESRSEKEVQAPAASLTPSTHTQPPSDLRGDDSQSHEKASTRSSTPAMEKVETSSQKAATVHASAEAPATLAKESSSSSTHTATLQEDAQAVAGKFENSRTPQAASAQSHEQAAMKQEASMRREGEGEVAKGSISSSALPSVKSHPSSEQSTTSKTEPPAQSKRTDGGAVIVRRAPPTAPQASPSSSGYRSGGGMSANQQQSSYSSRPGQGSSASGGREGYRENYQGRQGTSSDARGGTRSGTGSSYGSRDNRPPYQAREGQQPHGGRSGAPQRGGPGSGSSSGGRDSAGGFRREGGGGYGGGVSVRSGAQSGGGVRPFIMGDAPAPAPAKDVPSRLKDREKDREKRKADEEESARKAAIRAKGSRHFNADVEDDIYSDYIEPGEDQGSETATVRSIIPNRKKSSAALKKKKKAEPVVANPTKASKKIVRIDDTITVNDLASALSQKAVGVIKALMKAGMMATINQVLDFETASFVAQEFGYEAQNSSVSIGDILSRKTDKIEQGDVVTRSPIITIMGHVDHGKTSLLDAIRSANVADKEAGGITQHIGAYQITYEDRQLTFLDTPGHEAFTSMRARGAQITDIVVLVVAADDGVMPQTVEAISHAKAANVPIIVAINKIDKAGIDIDRITRELADQGVLPEEWGGDSMFVKVSAKTRLGLNDLIESILLQADVLDLKASKDGLAEGVVIEAKLDKARGPLATVIVTRGTLKHQDFIVVGRTMGRIRAMSDDRGNRITSAGPATPVEIIGLDGVPAAGDQFNCVVNEAIAKEAVAYRIEKQRQKDLGSQRSSSMEELLAIMGSSENKAKELCLIIKADTHGSVEAIRGSLQKLDSAKVKTKVLHGAVGGITETDVSLANASGALILGFNVRPDRLASQEAERVGVKIQCFSIIYELIEVVQAAMVGSLAPVKVDKVVGHAEVRNTFSVPKIGTIAGCMVTDGKILRNCQVRVIRDGIVIYTGRVGSLKRFKDDAKEVLQGFECGLGVENYNDLKIGDRFEAFVVEEVAATLN